jgi:hypothetical protein
MSEGSKEEVPAGCPGCNPDGVLPLLEARNIRVEEVPRPRHAWTDIIVCEACGRAWLMIPRRGDPGAPVA